MNCKFCNQLLNIKKCNHCQIQYDHIYNVSHLFYKKTVLCVTLNHCQLFIEKPTKNIYQFDWKHIAYLPKHILNLSLQQIHQKIDTLLVFL